MAKRKTKRLAIVLGSALAVGFAVGLPCGGAITHQLTPKTHTIAFPDEEDLYIFDVPLSENLQRYIYGVCEEKDVPVELAIAMIDQESGFNADEVSDTDDYGLMQINSCNHERFTEMYGVTDFMNPYQNVFCGITMISDLILRYDSLSQALMAYNMGETGAQQAWEHGVYNTPYSNSIMTKMGTYEALRNE